MNHALLSASSSARWLACPPSARLNAAKNDRGSPYAQEGTDAHALCEFYLARALHYDAVDPSEYLTYLNTEMREAAEGYTAFVLQQLQPLRDAGQTPLVLIEQRLDFSRWVKDGFGTGDCVILSDGLLHIIDFKYGMGVRVSAAGEDGTGNSQLKCYALGALHTFGSLYDLRRVRLSIYQPRLRSEETFDLSREALLDWADRVLAPTAALAWEGKGELCAGSHCVFCKVKATCRKNAEYQFSLARYDFSETEPPMPTVPRLIPPSQLTPDEVAAILPRIDSLVSWAQSVRDYALEQSLRGVRFPGLRVVEGRAVRRYRDEALVASIVREAGFDPYEKKLLGITAMTRQLGKRKFSELLSDQIYKPPGKPVLVSEDDPRPDYNPAALDFAETENERIIENNV